MAEQLPTETTRAQLETMSKDELVDLLLLSLNLSRETNKNMQQLAEVLERTAKTVNELDSKCQSQEAELILLRNRP